MRAPAHEPDRAAGPSPLLAGVTTCSREKPWGIHLFILGHCPRCGWHPNAGASAAASRKGRGR